jgi:hypothetical protein
MLGSPVIFGTLWVARLDSAATHAVRLFRHVFDELGQKKAPSFQMRTFRLLVLLMGFCCQAPIRLPLLIGTIYQ